LVSKNQGKSYLRGQGFEDFLGSPTHSEVILGMGSYGGLPLAGSCESKPILVGNDPDKAFLSM
jgi:hypothetical protein